MLDNADPLVEGDYDSLITLNGGMAHVYVAQRTGSAHDWTAPPDFQNDVLPIAARFYNNNIGLVQDAEGQFETAFEYILVRDWSMNAWQSPYQLLRKGANETFFGMPLDVAVDQGLLDSRYVDVVENLAGLKGSRSGDVIVFSSFMCLNSDAAFYFGSQLPSWHGSLCESDMTVPTIVSFPRGAGNELTRFNSIIAQMPQPPANVTITDIAPTIVKSLMETE